MGKLTVFRIENCSSQYGFGLWKLVFDLPGEKVNKLSQLVLGEFPEVLDQLEALGKSGSIEALMFTSAKPGQFIAGADIALIQAVHDIQSGEKLCHQGHGFFNRWEDLPFPTVAAIDGNALGGGCEWSLASTAIVMSTSPVAKLGLPEVLLGIIPGLGGCVRMTRKVGLATALDLILNGKSLDGIRAEKAGLVEACIPKENFEAGVAAWIKRELPRLSSGARIAREPKLGGAGGVVGSLLENNPIGRGVILNQARKGVMGRTHGHYPAPLEVLRVCKDAGLGYGPRLTGEARKRAQTIEAQAFARCAVTEVSKNLIRLFFLTENIKKQNGLPDSGRDIKGKTVRSGAVLGAGIMGGGIAQLLAEKGVVARMKDINLQGLETGMRAAADIFKKAAKRRKITEREFLQKMNLITPTQSYDHFEGVEVVIEAVLENLDVKKKVFQELETHISDDCVVASNTSSLSINEMQKAFKHPERFVGMHFFNPVSKMPLIEVIKGEKTSDLAVATIFEFSKRLGKTPIVVKDGAGFLVNRLLCPYLNEAMYLLEDGARIDEVDRALLQFGMPMGPIELVDEIGIDTGAKVLKILHQAFGERMLAVGVSDIAIKTGRLGKKNGKGFSLYSGPGGRIKKPDPEIYSALGLTPKSGGPKPEEMVDRCILPMINEASRCLDEGVVAGPSEVDLGMIMGTGFPPFRGGLLRYADSVGAKVLVEKLLALEKRFGARYSPAPGLVAMAKTGRKFHS